MIFVSCCFCLQGDSEDTRIVLRAEKFQLTNKWSMVPAICEGCVLAAQELLNQLDSESVESEPSDGELNSAGAESILCTFCHADGIRRKHIFSAGDFYTGNEVNDDREEILFRIGNAFDQIACASYQNVVFHTTVRVCNECVIDAIPS